MTFITIYLFVFINNNGVVLDDYFDDYSLPNI